MTDDIGVLALAGRGVREHLGEICAELAVEVTDRWPGDLELAAVVVEVSSQTLAELDALERRFPELATAAIVLIAPAERDLDEVLDGRPARRVDSLRSPVHPRILRSKLEVLVELSRHRTMIDLESVERLAGSVAHDYNNLLMGVRGCLEIALARLERDHPARAFIDEARQSARRGAALAHQLLVFSGDKHHDLVALGVDAAIRESTEALRTILGGRVALELDLDGGEWAVEIDRESFEHAMANLVTNGSEAMPDGGAMTISTRRVAGECGDEVAIAVTDNGTGIAAAHKGRIFEPFFTTRAACGAAGLGLPTVRRIVEHAGGWIDVRSASGRGTTVTVRLPRLAGDRG